MFINKPSHRGDTLIEVLFATAVFSLVAVGALSIMNQGTATAQRALEITLVRNEIDAQAETLRFLNSSYIAAYKPGTVSYPDKPADEWHLIKDKAPSTATITDLDNCDPTLNSKSFVLNTRTAKFVPPNTVAGKPGPAKTFSQVMYDNASNVTSVEGIWIEAASTDPPVGSADQANAGYIDFHIRACWDSPGQSVPVTLGTIVRLYEPR